jgi:polysaccharide export outer membrane protein
MIKKYRSLWLVRINPNIAYLTIFISLLISSCKVYKPTYYFKDITRDTVIAGVQHPNLELKIQKNDVLSITVSSLSPTEDALYSKGASSASAEITGFQVDLDGNIYLHKLGKLAVAGMTRQQLKLKLENDLLPYLKDPVVTVSFLNHRVTVFGETNSMVVNMPDEKIPLLEVMATAHPVTQNSELNQVLVIRETTAGKEFKHLNLENFSIITSPWYYLQPNDIVVVKINEEKVVTEAKRTRNQVLFATVISSISFLLLILDRISR